MNRFTIKNLESLSGVKAHTIRIWEKRYALLVPTRSNTNIRYYTLENLRLFLNISLLNKYGFKISQLIKIPEQNLQNLIATLKYKEAVQEYSVNELILKMFNLDITGFENFLTGYININGIAASVSCIIFPFLQKIELLRNEKHLSSECERLMQNIIRQKLIAAIEQQNFTNQYKKTVLAFLPEDDYYEIELLYAQYSLKQQGIRVIYLGINVPEKDVKQIALNKKPDFIYTQYSNRFRYNNMYKFIEKLSQHFKKFTVIVTSAQLQSFKKSIPSNIQLKFSIPEAVNFIMQ